jgi:type II secretory pathway pseudopilin PulG
MMDDFKPNQQEPAKTAEPPVSYREETTSDETTPTQAVVTAPKKPSRVKGWLLGGFVVVIIAALAALTYWQWQEAESAKQSLTAAENQLKSAQNELSNAKPTKEDAPSNAAPLTEDEKITLAASNYICIQANAGCDKVTETVTKKQSPTVDKAGFAIVKAGDAASGAGMKIYLKSTSMGDWIVIYDGQNTPPEDVVKKFAIPAGFTS